VSRENIINDQGKEKIISFIVKDLGLKEFSVRNTVSLLEDKATVPFISRYRKEKTGNLDETKVKAIAEKLQYFTELQERKQTVLKTIAEQGQLSPELKQKIEICREKQILEDLYLPFKPKKRTRATLAREKGLAPLAEIMLDPQTRGSKQDLVSPFIDQEKGIADYEQAVSGACDIIAETIAENADLRDLLRNLMLTTGKLSSKVQKKWAEQKTKYETYYNYSEPVKNVLSHRILALRRATREGVLSWKIEIDEEKAYDLIRSRIIFSEHCLFRDELCLAIKDSCSRLLFPSLETEVFLVKFQQGEKEAISVFSKNLKNLLLAPPAGEKNILGLDPGFRTGCKSAVIDKNGNFLQYRQIFPHPPQNKREEAKKILSALISEYDIDLIAIGNGTASKETYILVRELIAENKLKAKAVVVSEAGASVYSASETAIREFPDLDLTVRGAISIARRLQYPLAELVKIDPKAIGVGQYQHDVNQTRLKDSLGFTVESCVNYVGADLNTASAALLSYVSGIGPSLAEKIVAFRKEHGSFCSKQELLKVPRLGEKVFEQCAGFLRLSQGRNPLDNSAIHPERYALVEAMASDCNVSVSDLIKDQDLDKKLDLNRYVGGDVGLPTLRDIVKELKKPGLDPRKEFSCLEFSSEINDLDDLALDMVLPGKVTNVTNFGAFVDIGVHQDGLVHISKMSRSFVRDPHQIAAVGDTIKVKIISLDKDLKRISLEIVE